MLSFFSPSTHVLSYDPFLFDRHLGDTQKFIGYRRFRRPPLLGKRRSALDFWRFWKFLIFVKNVVFGHFGGALETRGFRKFQFFWFWVDFKILVFLIFWAVWKFWWEATALCLWVSVSHPPNHVRKGLVARFLTILKISDFCQKFGFWCFGGHWTLGDSRNFNFFDV